MKTINVRYIVLLLALFALQSKVVGQNLLLLDSLHGTWTLKEQYTDSSRIETKGTVEFLEDGTFKSHGSYFGSALGLYTTNETKSTIHIEINGASSEWSAAIKNHVLRMTRVSKKKTPRIDLVLWSEKSENSSGN